MVLNTWTQRAIDTKEKWAQSHGKIYTEDILPVYKRNNLPRVGHKAGQGPSLEGFVYTKPCLGRTCFKHETTVLRMQSAILLSKLT